MEAVLRIRILDPVPIQGSGIGFFLIPVPGYQDQGPRPPQLRFFFGPRKELGNPGSRTNPLRIPDPGVKKAPDPGSGSATLVDCFFFTTAVHSLTVDKVIHSLFSALALSRDGRREGACSTTVNTGHSRHRCDFFSDPEKS